MAEKVSQMGVGIDIKSMEFQLEKLFMGQSFLEDKEQEGDG